MRAREILALTRDLMRVAVALPSVERGFRAEGPATLLERLRTKGERAAPRDADSRARLQRAIIWVDACLPPGKSCYRRALLEIALDPDAARTKLRMGLSVRGDTAQGHTWLGTDETQRRYDIELDV